MYSCNNIYSYNIYIYCYNNYIYCIIEMFDFQELSNKIKQLWNDNDSESDNEDTKKQLVKNVVNTTQKTDINVKEIKQSGCGCQIKKPEPPCPNEMRMNHTFSKDDFENMKPADDTREYVYPTFGRNNYGLTGRRSDYAFRSREKYHTDRTREYFTVQCENELYSSFPSCRNDLMISGRDKY